MGDRRTIGDLCTGHKGCQCARCQLERIATNATSEAGTCEPCRHAEHLDCEETTLGDRCDCKCQAPAGLWAP